MTNMVHMQLVYKWESVERNQLIESNSAYCGYILATTPQVTSGTATSSSVDLLLLIKMKILRLYIGK